MSKLFNSKNTLRDLAIQLKQDLVKMTRLMIPYFQLGLIELVEIPDLSSPWSQPELTPIPEVPPTTKGKALIVCIDHSFPVTEQMKQIVTSNGYNFLSFNDISLAIASLSFNKPDLVFLDLSMPNINAYEVCNQLRQLSSFQLSSSENNIPIVIMSESLGLKDKVMAKIAGYSDFLSKPFDAQRVLIMIAKHLQTSS